MTTITLRNIVEDDLVILFQNQCDIEAQHMAAFTDDDPNNEAAFYAKWRKHLANDAIVNRVIIYQSEVAGYITHFDFFGEPSIGYWLGRDYWGKGIATEALRLFLNEIVQRPLYARAAKDNAGSLRVLQKCGFNIIGDDSGFAHARKAEIEEYLLRLDAP